MQTKQAIDIFINSRHAKGLSPHTIRWYKGILTLFAQRYPKLPSKPEVIEVFLTSCQAGDERRHGYYRTLRCLYRFLHKRLKVANIIEMVDVPRRKKKLPLVLTQDQLEQLLSYPHRPIIKACLLFLTDTGCRVGELATLKPENLIETPQGYIAKVRGKTGERLVPISIEVYTSIRNYLPLPFTAYRLRRKMTEAFKDAHVPGSALTLRHTFATLWQGDELILQRIMGHAYLTTTQIYRHLRVQSLVEQHNQYTPLRYVFASTRAML